MKRLVIAIFMMLALAGMVACGSESNGSEAGQSAAIGNTAQFHELSFRPLEGWIEKDTDKTVSVDEGRMWHRDIGDSGWSIRDGGIFAFRMNYDFLGNLDVGLSDYGNDEVREAEAAIQAAIKTVDARICAKLMADTYGDVETKATAYGQESSLDARNEADEKDFSLENQNGCAVWSMESKDSQGALYTCAVPYDDHVITVAIASEGDDFSEEERAVIDSLSFAGDPNSQFYETAKPMVGITSEVALKYATSTIGNLKVPTSTKSNSG